MMIEIGQYPLLAKVMSDDYATYTGDTLERYFKAKMMEEKKYRAIGSWWDSKGYIDSKGNHQQCEIDIVAVGSDNKNIEIIEVKRNPEKFNKETMDEKVRYFTQKEKRIRRYKRIVRCLSLEDM